MWNYEPKPKPHYGLAYPPKPFRWRRWLGIAFVLGLAFWHFDRNEFVVIEIDDGPAPSFGQYQPPRLFNGRASEPIATVPVDHSGPERHSAILHTAFAARRDTLRIERNARSAGPYPPPLPIEVGKVRIPPFRCVVVVRWTKGVPAAQACATIPGEWSRIERDDPYQALV